LKNKKSLNAHAGSRTSGDPRYHLGWLPAGSPLTPDLAVILTDRIRQRV
jgi:hypothetical protein